MVSADLNRRWIILIFSHVEILLYGGLMMGWGELVYVFKHEGIFLDRCTRNGTNLTATSCDAAENMFDLYFSLTTAIGTMIVLPLGYCFSRLGTRITRVLFTLACTVGCIMMAFADNDRPWLICVGGIILMGSGYVYHVTSIQIAKLFAGNASATVISSISGMRISSSTVMMLLKVAYINGISQRDCFLFLGVLTSIPLLSTFTLYPKMFFNDVGTMEYNSLQESTQNVPAIDNKKTDSIINSNEMPANEIQLTDRTGDTSNYGTLEAESTIRTLMQSERPNTTGEGTVETFKLSTFLKAFFSLHFGLHVFWLTAARLRIMYFFGEINHYIEKITDFDDVKVSYYTDVVYRTTSFGVIISLIIGVVYDFHRRLFTDIVDPKRRRVMSTVLPLTATSIAGGVVTCLLSSTNPGTTYGLAVMVTLLQALTMSVGSTYLSDLFHVSMFGSLYGARTLIVYGLSFLQYPLSIWTRAYPGADLHVTLFLVAFAVLSLIHPLSLYRASKKLP